MNKMYLVIGDWSDDGHGKYDKLLVRVNKSVEEVQNAYKTSCLLTGISFNGNDDFTGRKRTWRSVEKYLIATDYEQFGTLHDETKEILKEFNCPCIVDFEESASDTFPDLWFWFVKLSLPDLEYEIVQEKDTTPVINGYWDKNLNVQFGYGLYT